MPPHVGAPHRSPGGRHDGACPHHICLAGQAVPNTCPDVTSGHHPGCDHPCAIRLRSQRCVCLRCCRPPEPPAFCLAGSLGSAPPGHPRGVSINGRPPLASSRAGGHVKRCQGTKHERTLISWWSVLKGACFMWIYDEHTDCIWCARLTYGYLRASFPVGLEGHDLFALVRGKNAFFSLQRRGRVVALAALAGKFVLAGSASATSPRMWPEIAARWGDRWMASAASEQHRSDAGQ